MNVFDSIMKGLEQSVDYENGNGKARITKMSVQPLPDVTADEIKELRHNLGFTQSVFAAVMGVSPKTVEAWEAGTNHPVGSARRMISLIRFDPSVLQKAHIIEE